MSKIKLFISQAPLAMRSRLMGEQQLILQHFGAEAKRFYLKYYDQYMLRLGACTESNCFRNITTHNINN
jgi:hypothetical protein